MFGEAIIIGHATGKLDNKNRIFIPPFTKVEPKEKIVIEKTIYQDELALKLHSYHKYYDMIVKLQQLQEKVTTLEEFNELQSKIENLCRYLFAIVNVDSNKRITIPKTIIDTLNWSLDEPISMNGIGNSLLITQSKK